MRFSLGLRWNAPQGFQLSCMHLQKACGGLDVGSGLSTVSRLGAELYLCTATQQLTFERRQSPSLLRKKPRSKTEEPFLLPGVMLSFCKSQPVSSFNSIYLILKGLWEQLERGWGYYCTLQTQWVIWGLALNMKSAIFLQVIFKYVWMGSY